MTRTKSSKSFVAAVLVMVLLAASCGSDSPKASTAGSTATPSSAAPAIATTTDASAASSVATVEPASSTTTATGITPQWQAVIDGAKKEGKVTLYSSFEDDRSAALKAAFEKAYPGVSVEFLRIISLDASPKLEAERTSGAPGGDVYVDNDQIFLKAQLAIDPARLADLTGPAFANLDPGLMMGGGKGAAVRYGAVGLGWNTTQVSAPLTSVRDLLKPEFAGKVGLPGIRSSNIQWWDLLEKDGGPGFLQELAATHPKYLVQSGDLAQATASGEIAVAAFALYPLFQGLKNKGAPVDITLKLSGAEKAYGSLYMVQVPGWSQHPNAAQLLANFIVTPEGQAIIAKDDVAVLPGIKEAAVSSSELQLATGDLAPDVDARVAEVKQIFGQ